MRRLRILLLAVLAVLLLLAAAAAAALPQAQAAPKRAGALDAALQAIVDRPERPLSGLAAITVRNGSVSYEGYFGYRFIDNEDPVDDLPVERSTKFRIASISKLVAAIGVMQQVEAGRIDLDADAGTYLGFPFRNPAYPDVPITVRMLLSHTSSVRDGSRYTFPPADGLDEVFLPGKYWRGGEHWAPLGEAPGHYFTYANLNYGVLATILERVTGMRFDAYMRTRVLLPLGCAASYNVRDFTPDELAQVATLYRKRDAKGTWDPAGPWYPQVDDYRGVMPPEPEGAAEYLSGTNATWQGPQGGLRISALDLSKVMRMFINGGVFRGVRLLQPETVDLMFTPEWTYDETSPNGDTYWDLMRSYGLGPHILTNTGGDRLLADRDVFMSGHLGEAYGLLSGMMMDREGGDGFIYLIGGLGADPDEHFGEYSTFYKWEEEIITELFEKELLR